MPMWKFSFACLQTWIYVMTVRSNLYMNKAWGEKGKCPVLAEVVGAGQWQDTKSQEKFSEN